VGYKFPLETRDRHKEEKILRPRVTLRKENISGKVKEKQQKKLNLNYFSVSNANSLVFHSAEFQSRQTHKWAETKN